MNIRFSKPQEYIITTLQSICLFLAGVGSGKTFIIGFLSGYYINKFPKVPGFIGANTYMQLSQSTLFRVRKVWSEIFGWEEGIDYVVSRKPPKHFDTNNHEFVDYRSIISFIGGTVVFIGSLDNAKAHEGKEFGWAFLDETKDSREDDVKDIILARLRSGGIYVDGQGQLTDQKQDDKDVHEVFNPLYILTSPAKVEWINEWFNLDDYQEEIQRLIYDKESFFTKEFGDKCVVISSTYHNETNLPQGYIEKQIANRTEEKAKMLIYGNPFVRSGGEFYSGFERLKHVKPVSFKPDLPIHMSFDQNVVPYITMTLHHIWNDGSKKIIGQFDELCLSNPKNKTSKLCLEFIRKYGSRCSGLYFYGDPAGRKSDTRQNEHDYKIVERMLRKYLNNQSNRVPYVHPRVLKRKDFINNIFEDVYPDYEINIDPSCKYTVADYEFVKEDVNGKKAKKKVKDKDTGATYEKYGHTSDANDYLYCELLKPLFRKHFK